MGRKTKQNRTSKKTSSKTKKQETIAVAAPPAPEPVKVTEPVNQVQEELSYEKYNSQFSTLITELQHWRCNITSMIAQVRTLQRCVEKEMKNSSRRSKKSRDKPKTEP